MTALAFGFPLVGAVEMPLETSLTQKNYLEALAERIQQLIDRVPETDVHQLKDLLETYLTPLDLVPTYQNLMFLGTGIVEALADAGFLTVPMPGTKPRKSQEAAQILQDDLQAEPMERLESWLSAATALH